MKSLCFIPARGGSKRIPRKNLQLLDSIPLITFTIRAAKKSGIFNKIVLSSDDKEILEIGRNEGLEVDVRPIDYGGDLITKDQVLFEYMGRNNVEKEFDTVAVLLPTCPFRNEEHVREAMSLFNIEKQTDVLISVCEYEFPIQFSISEIGKNLFVLDDENSFEATRSQEKEVKYHPNGAIYITTTSSFMKTRSFFKKELTAYKMSALSSYDIDYSYQLEIAEILVEKIKNKKIKI